MLRFALLFLTLMGSALAQEWQAMWITPDSGDTTAANSWYCFRKTVYIPDKPYWAKAKIAVDSKYWLYINGEMVVFEGGLKRGPAPGDTYYDTVDLAPHLKSGSNTIALLLWFFGKNGFAHENSGKAGVLFECITSDFAIVSDGSWKVIENPAFGESTPPHPNYRLSESNIHYNANKELIGWMLPEFDDSLWDHVYEWGYPPIDPWNHLVARPIPLWKNSGLLAYGNHRSWPEISTGEPIAAELPYNAQVTPYFKIMAQEGQFVDIRTDHYRGGGPENVRCEYITRKGLQEFECLAWMNGHRVFYTFPEDVKILELGYRESGYNTEFTGKFECNIDFFNRLWNKAQRTLYVTMRDNYMDCPDRERAQWWGDAVIEIGESFYAMDPKSHLLAKKAILELINWQREDGTLFSPVPSGNYDKELPMQMLASVGYYGFWNYFMHTGDRTTIQSVYGGSRTYLLNVWQLDEKGLVIPRKGGWTWGDWGKNKDMNILYNGWYVLALEGLRNMAELLGREKDLAEIETRLAKLRANFHDTFWTGKEYRSSDYNGETDDRANALAVVAGLVPSRHFTQVRRVLMQQHHASPYMEKYVLQALFMMGYTDDALSRMHDRYQPMVISELSTLWEGWGIGDQGFGGGTANHAWSGGPLTLLSKYVAGVEPVMPGYEMFHVHPHLGNSIKNVNCRVHTVRGFINLEIEKQTMMLSMILQSPLNTRALVSIPIPQGRVLNNIKVNDQIVYHSQQEGESLLEFAFYRQTDDTVQFIAEPGHWNIEAFYR
ncbi:Bacterial alpha-L-rhamnosidase [candidate division KSB1 bacterium]|nr:Bacterial alpha-L-rhamnosidase [candidate division KSB1 bacterium]